eukprot:4477890-Prymnesium_polylepis.1
MPGMLPGGMAAAEGEREGGKPGGGCDDNADRGIRFNDSCGVRGVRGVGGAGGVGGHKPSRGTKPPSRCCSGSGELGGGGRSSRAGGGESVHACASAASGGSTRGEQLPRIGAAWPTSCGHTCSRSLRGDGMSAGHTSTPL